MRNVLFFFLYVMAVAFTPLVYTCLRAISRTKLRDRVFVVTLAKDFLRTFPACAIVSLPVLLFPNILPVYAIVLNALFIPLMVLELGHVFLFRTRIGLNTFYSLFVSNVQETKEYIAQNVTARQGLFLAATYATTFACAACLRPPHFPSASVQWTLVALDVALIVPFALNLFRDPDARKDGYVMNPYTNVLYHYALFRRNYRELQRMIGEHAAPKFEGIRSSLPEGTRETYVIIIGESANATHFGCYGYARPTTPFTDALGDEIVRVAGVRSPFAQTIPSLEKVLTFADAEHPDWVYTKGSIIDFFNDAGFKTFWYSNQYALDDTALTAMTTHATVSKCFNFSGMKRFEKAGLDGNMLPDIQKALNDPAPRKVLFVHCIGSHSAYVNRYPDDFHHFEGQVAGRNLEPEKVQLLNAYDDSIRYTDWFVAQIIAALRTVGGVGYALYFADHGEDVYDSTDRRILGHSQLANEPMTSVPFMLWRSPALATRQPEIAHADVPKGYPLQDAIHTIIGISSLTGPEYIGTRSAFGDNRSGTV